MATQRWEFWRTDTPEQQIRNVARDLDESDARFDRHDRYHRKCEDDETTRRADVAADETQWRKHVDDEIDGLKKVMYGLLLTMAGFVVAAALNVALLIAQG